MDIEAWLEPEDNSNSSLYRRPVLDPAMRETMGKASQSVLASRDVKKKPPSAYHTASQSIAASPSATPWRTSEDMSDERCANGVAALERTVGELEIKYQQVCEERDALEDLLLQEQLKNGTSRDKQLEEAAARATELELELRAMASKCEEWKKRAAQKAAEMNPQTVQALLDEYLADVDQSGIVQLQTEVARLREELARSEVLRFELYRQLQEGFGSGTKEVRRKWEAEEEGLEEQLAEMQVGFEIQEAKRFDANEYPRWCTPQGAAEASSPSEDDGGDVVQELLELGEASMNSDELERLTEAVEAAEARAAEAEREVLEKTSMIELLEAKLAALASDSPLELQQKFERRQGLHPSHLHSVKPTEAGAAEGRDDVEELRKIALKIQGQNRFSHFLLSIVALASIGTATFVSLLHLKDMNTKDKR